MSLQIDFSLSVPLYMLLFTLRKHTGKVYTAGQNTLSHESFKNRSYVSAKNNNPSFWIYNSYLSEKAK